MHHTLYGTSSNFLSTAVSFKHVSSVFQLTMEFSTHDWRPLNRGSIQTQGGSLAHNAVCSAGFVNSCTSLQTEHNRTIDLGR